MLATVKRSFIDLKGGVTRQPGEKFELTAARYKEIDGKLPGYVEPVVVPAHEVEAVKPKASAKPRAKRRAPANKAKDTSDK